MSTNLWKIDVLNTNNWSCYMRKKCWAEGRSRRDLKSLKPEPDPAKKIVPALQHWLYSNTLLRVIATYSYMEDYKAKASLRLGVFSSNFFSCKSQCFRSAFIIIHIHLDLDLDTGGTKLKLDFQQIFHKWKISRYYTVDGNKMFKVV